MKKTLILIAVLATFPAYAQVAPAPRPMEPQQPNVALTAGDLANIQRMIGESRLSVRFDDGSTHALVDGTALASFLGQKAEQAKHEATNKAAQEREEAAKAKAPHLPVKSALPAPAHH